MKMVNIRLFITVNYALPVICRVQVLTIVFIGVGILDHFAASEILVMNSAKDKSGGTITLIGMYVLEFGMQICNIATIVCRLGDNIPRIIQNRLK